MNRDSRRQRGRGVPLLLKEYEQAARLEEFYSQLGDDRKANEQHDKLRAVYREIKAHGREASLSILRLLDSDSIGVRIWTAYFSLEFAPEIGASVLEEISRTSKGIQRFTAEMTLKEWKAGRLKFD